MKPPTITPEQAMSARLLSDFERALKLVATQVPAAQSKPVLSQPSPPTKRL